MKTLFLIAACLPFIAFIVGAMLVDSGLLKKANGEEEEPYTTSEVSNELLA